MNPRSPSTLALDLAGVRIRPFECRCSPFAARALVLSGPRSRANLAA